MLVNYQSHDRGRIYRSCRAIDDDGSGDRPLRTKFCDSGKYTFTKLNIEAVFTEYQKAFQSRSRALWAFVASEALARV